MLSDYVYLIEGVYPWLIYEGWIGVPIMLLMFIGPSMVYEVDVGKRCGTAAPLAEEDYEEAVFFLRSFFCPEWNPPVAVAPT